MLLVMKTTLQVAQRSCCMAHEVLAGPTKQSERLARELRKVERWKCWPMLLWLPPPRCTEGTLRAVGDIDEGVRRNSALHKSAERGYRQRRKPTGCSRVL